MLDSEYYEIIKIAKFNGEMLESVRNTASQCLQILYMLVLRAGIFTIFETKMLRISAGNTNIINLQSSQDYIFPTSQHVATNLCNFANFTVFSNCGG